MIKAEELLKIGYINKVHGTQGEVEFRFTDDIFDRVDAEYLFINMDGHPVPFFMDEYRFKSDESVLVKFEDIDNADSAEKLCGAEVMFPKDLVENHEGLPVTWNYLTGFKVFGINTGLVGEINSVDDSSANILLCVKCKDGKEILLPFHPDLLVKCDEKQRELTLDFPDALITLND